MVKEIVAVVTLYKNADSKMRGIADVTLDLGDAGKVRITGFRIIATNGNGEHWVAAPARQGTKVWFETVTITGALKKLVEAKILDEFASAAKQYGN